VNTIFNVISRAYKGRETAKYFMHLKFVEKSTNETHAGIALQRVVKLEKFFTLEKEALNEKVALMSDLSF
jgi:hypothetical protein